ncbi:MAG: hypothetical protein JNL01_00960 [Bdellovibrionales bacterium]|nr:hypothetical protein [Bdellovibrionales bacterium]
MITAIAGLVGLAGCAIPGNDIGTELGRQNILESTHKALTNGECALAINLIEPLYNSVHSNDAVRMAYAAAHGCNAGINFFQLLDVFVATPPVGTAFWTTMAENFYHTDLNFLDQRVESTRRATYALFSVIGYGIVVPLANQVNWSSFNPGSLLAVDRSPDSNLYNVLISAARIGALQNRYSAPDTTTWNKTQVVGYTVGNPNGWQDATLTADHGCQFASAFLNFIDSVDQIAVNPGGSSGAAIATVTAAIKPVIGEACNYGCQGNAAGVIGSAPPEVIDFSGTGCAFADNICAGTASVPCPQALRDATACTGLVTDRNSCAAAGIARFVNMHTTLGWP